MKPLVLFYVYKNNAARDLDYMSLPNNLRSYPQTDVNGRSEGKILTNASNAAQFGEYKDSLLGYQIQKEDPSTDLICVDNYYTKPNTLRY